MLVSFPLSEEDYCMHRSDISSFVAMIMDYSARVTKYLHCLSSTY